MAKIEDGKIVLTKDELNLLKNSEELELIPNQEGVFLLIDKKIALEQEGKQVCVEVPLIEEQEQVLKLIEKGNLSELVEGKFEETLNEKQQRALLELIVAKKVFVFKLSESYKKGVYRIKEDEEKTGAEEKNGEKTGAEQKGKLEEQKSELENEEQKKKIKIFDSENSEATPRLLTEYSLEKDGFVATKNVEMAKALSNKYRKRIEDKELIGIRNFEGVFYLIENKLLEKYLKKFLEELEKEKTITIEGITKKLNVSIELTKIVLEFLKEDGEIIEKKKGSFNYIS